MSIKSISVKNALSFDDFSISDMKDLNCIIGKNNVGKSNLIKLVKFFYNKLKGERELPPELYSNYCHKGSITIVYDTTRIFRMSRKQPSNKYFNFIVRKLIPVQKRSSLIRLGYNEDYTEYSLTLNIYNDGVVKWSTTDRQILNLILYLYPFFNIDTRHIDLYEWNDLWDLIARLKSFNLSSIDNDSIVDFFDQSIGRSDESLYKSYVSELQGILPIKPSSQKERILSYIMAGMRGYKFEIDENDLKYHSDGTNSYHFVKVYLQIIITIAKREYISPFVFIDEPEVGLHPKMNDTLIRELYSSYNYEEIVKGSNIRPRIFLATHSPTIVKEVIKTFRDKQKVYCLKKSKHSATKLSVLNSTYDSESFINIFSENEARLFFSDFILFVEGETEVELFGNIRLADWFPHLKKIDVYKSSSNTIGERVNPSYSNAAIPYLFLFDADKAISVAGSPNNYKLKLKKNGEYFNFYRNKLVAERNKFNYGYSKSYQDKKKNLDYLINHLDMALSVNLTEQVFNRDTDFEFLFKKVKARLLDKNMYVNRTTSEGFLIQIDSFPIFSDWLSKHYNIKANVLFRRLVKNTKVSERMMVNHLRVLFNGKTDVLNKYSNFEMKSTNAPVNTTLYSKRLMQLLERKIVRNEDLGKTSGWVTNFLHHALDYVSKESVEEQVTFISKFTFYFPEFYDIIILLQPDSRGEVVRN